MIPEPIPVPSAGEETRHWQQEHRGGTVDDRRFSMVTTSMPAPIAHLRLSLPGAMAAKTDEAIAAIAGLDAEHRHTLAPLSYLLLRSESIASSKIEAESAPLDDYVRALHGVRANRSATAMAAATGALDLIISGELGWDSLCAGHRRLMVEDESEAHLAGDLRPMQNWIGGSDHSPRGALYVPPPPELLPELIADLMDFVGRWDLPILPQAAIAHAQFEAIHPFTDGNGRIGRALAAGILARRGVVESGMTVPVAAALAEVRAQYFSALTAFHAGDAGPIISLWAGASLLAAEESRVTASRLARLPSAWESVLGGMRRGSAVARVIDYLRSTPVFLVDDLEGDLSLSSSTASRTVSTLVEAGILRGLTTRTRNQIWGADDVLVELEDLGLRIGARARIEL